MALRIDLDRCQFSAGLRERPRYPHARMPGGRPDFQGASVSVLEDQVVERLAVTFRHVEIAPRAAAVIEESLDLSIQLAEAILIPCSAEQVACDQRSGPCDKDCSPHDVSSFLSPPSAARPSIFS